MDRQTTCSHCGARIHGLQSDADAPIWHGISIVIPVFNEAPQIEAHLRVIREHLGAVEVATELVVVDDGSADNTWQVLERLRNEIPELSAIRLSRNFGKEAAISAGLTVSRGAACVVMDSDLQHPPNLLPEMVRLWRDEHWDVVEGVKVARGKERLANRVGARLFYRMLSRLSGYDLDGASDFKLLDRRVIDAWKQMGERNTFFRGMITWLGYRRKALPFSVPPRTETATRWSLLSLFRLAIVAITAFSSLPLQIVTILGVVFLLCSGALAIESLYNYFSGHALPGFTTVILLELIIGGVLMLSLGIIGTYMGRIYEEAKHRPRYLISSVAEGAKRESELREDSIEDFAPGEVEQLKS